MSVRSLRRNAETALRRSGGGLVLGLWLLASPVQAQPQAAAPDLYGDRQAGNFGDQSAGHFGNPAFGSFDSSGVRTPPPGTRPLGRVYEGRVAEPPPYISLPEPLPEKAAPVRPAPATKTPDQKKPAKKRAS